MLILTASLLVVAAFAVLMYNRLVRDRNRVAAAWGDIDVQLQRRYDLIPRLVKAVDQYARYERATLEAVTALRDEASAVLDVEERGQLEERLSRNLDRLIAVAEDYPDLKASGNFMDLQQALVETENYLQFARRFYNGAVRALNTRIETVPHNVVAAAFGFERRGYFQKASDEAASVPLVQFGSVE